MSVASVAFLAAGTILALVQLAGGTPVHGAQVGRVIELVLICAPVAALVSTLVFGGKPGHHHSRPPGDPPYADEMGLPDIPR